MRLAAEIGVNPANLCSPSGATCCVWHPHPAI